MPTYAQFGQILAYLLIPTSVEIGHSSPYHLIPYLSITVQSLTICRDSNTLFRWGPNTEFCRGPNTEFRQGLNTKFWPRSTQLSSIKYKHNSVPLRSNNSVLQRSNNSVPLESKCEAPSRSNDSFPLRSSYQALGVDHCTVIITLSCVHRLTKLDQRLLRPKYKVVIY